MKIRYNDFMKEKSLKWNLILLLAMLLTGGVIAGIVFLTSKNGAYVVVEQDGKNVGRYSLETDATYTFFYKDGAGENTIVIEDGQVYMSEANCPDKLCVNMGRISRTDQSIVCLPHKLVVTIEDEDEQNEIDGVAR